MSVSYEDGGGYVNDLVREAYKAAGWQVRYQVMPYARCKALAEQGKLAARFSASKTPQTLEKTALPGHTGVFGE